MGKQALLRGAGALPALLLAVPLWAGAPTFQELMDPRSFPTPQRGMVVEAGTLTDAAFRVTTTGALIQGDLARGEVCFQQRIGHPRPVARLRLGLPLRGGRLTHLGRGLARFTFEHPRVTVRVNGDSLLMLQVHEPLPVAVDRLMAPAWHASYQSNHLLVDEWGGFGLYCSEPGRADGFDPYAGRVARYPLPAGAVLWLAVCPPQPYPWQRSLRDNVVWHWSDTLAYPPDEVLRSWRELGNIVLLQSEVMLWQDWNLDFVPRLGPAEFGRVRETLHGLGMRFIVYTSPAYFLRGTPLERHAMNSFVNFQGWPPAISSGENIDLFLAAITRMSRQHRPDGLYFDGQYTSNPAALYALARQARALLGEEGILEWHSTTALGDGLCYLPPADAYVDFILRGEGANQRYTDFDYLRFFVSGYNINNCIGVICNNSGGLSRELVRRVLEANARFHTIAGWVHQPELMQVLREEYQARLGPGLQATVEAGANRRQAQVAAQVASKRAERAALQAAPAWGSSLCALTFPALPAARQLISPANPSPFGTEQGALTIQGRPHTYAYLALPLQGRAEGLVVKLRQGSDGGMSWGPGALLRFANGAFLRLGTRSDGRLQADLMGQQLVGGAYDPTSWAWLRARWRERWGVVEHSGDGKRYQVVWQFEHGGGLCGPVSELLVGKVPYNGQPLDFAAEGPVGKCEIGLVEVHGQP